MPSSLQFNGSSQYGSTTNIAAYLINTGTIEFWFKLAASVTSSYNMLFAINATYNYYYGVKATNALETSIGGASTASTLTTSNNIVIPGQWTHCATTFSSIGLNVTINTYVNGILVGTLNTSNGISTNGTTMYVGCFVGATDYFNGEIAQCTFYNVALSQSQVLQRFNNVPAQNVVPSNVVSQWNFNEGYGNVLHDAHNVSNFALVGSPVWQKDTPVNARLSAANSGWSASFA
jgi:hypothetical protein